MKTNKIIFSKKHTKKHTKKQSHKKNNDNLKYEAIFNIISELRPQIQKIEDIYNLPSPFMEILINKNIKILPLDLSHSKDYEITDPKLKQAIKFTSDQKQNKIKIVSLYNLNIPAIIKSNTHFTMGVSHNLSTFLNYKHFSKNKKDSFSNAYLKLWEIYHYFLPDIIKASNINPTEKPAFFHIAEFPGNWIKTTLHYFKLFYPNINFEWFANSLNPNNPKIKEQYGNVFKDEYKFLQNYPKQWLFGKDDTGDILNTENIAHMSNYFHQNNKKLMLITGDAGLPKTDDNELLLQKIEVAQLVMSLACLQKNGSTIMKHFLTSSGDEKEIIQNNHFTLNLIYTYFLFFNKVILIKPNTSNPNLSEYYLIGIGFKGITNNQLQNFFKYLNTMQLNDCIYPEKSINPIIKNKIFKFMTDIFNRMGFNKAIQSIHLTTLDSKLPNKIKNLIPLNKLTIKYKNKKHLNIYKKWQHKYKFDVNKIIHLSKL